jgi:glucokinase
VLGGGVAKAGDLLFDPLRRHLDRYARLSFTRAVEVLPAGLGGDAGLIGAAALVAHPDGPIPLTGQTAASAPTAVLYPATMRP